jgi:heme oxygenase
LRLAGCVARQGFAAKACVLENSFISQQSADHRASGAAVASSTIDSLRAATASVHRRLDQTLGLIDRLQQPETRAALLGRYYAFHKGAEIALAPFLSPISDLDFAARCRSPLIAQGLHDMAQPVPANALPGFDVGTRPEAFGAFYVLEGSSLGGRSILKSLVRRRAPLAGLGFLDPYGVRTAARWLGFLAILQRETANGNEAIAQAISGALKAFAFAELCLSKGDSS